MDYKCIDLNESHIPQAAALLKLWWVKHAALEPDYLNVPLFQEMDYEQYLRLQTLENPGAKGWVALDQDGNLVGYARVEIHKADRYRAFRAYLLVDDIVAVEDSRQAEIRECLLEHIENYARAQKIRSLFTRIYVFNKVDTHWFTNHGFDPKHTEYLKEL